MKVTDEIRKAARRLLPHGRIVEIEWRNWRWMRSSRLPMFDEMRLSAVAKGWQKTISAEWWERVCRDRLDRGKGG
jgi:hypothetical protein